MAERHSKQIPCDKRGNPIVPSDVSWQKAVGRAAALIPLGAVLLPLGLVLYNFVQLPEDLNIFSISFGLIAAFGLLFVLFGAVLLVLGLRARAKAPSAEETERRAKAEGERAYAKVTSVETRLRRTPEGSRRMVRVRAEYDDRLYRYRRKFVSEWSEAPAPSAGDKVRVYYFPDSNLGYYVELGTE